MITSDLSYGMTERTEDTIINVAAMEVKVAMEGIVHKEGSNATTVVSLLTSIVIAINASVMSRMARKKTEARLIVIIKEAKGKGKGSGNGKGKGKGKGKGWNR